MPLEGTTKAQQAQAYKNGQKRRAKLAVQARKDIAEAEKGKKGITYTALTHQKHAQILKSALTECKEALGLK